MKNYTNILIHYVLGIKEPSPVLENEAMRTMLCETVKSICEEQKYIVHCVGGATDHLHLVVKLGKNQKVARIAHTVQDLTTAYFRSEFGLPIAWDDSFLALSVAHHELPQLADNLAQHTTYHTKKTYHQEYDELTGRG